MTQTDKMLSRKEGGVGIVTFNNPDRLNAVSLEMWEATKRILDDFAADNDIRVVVLTGAGGKAFVSGADISKFESERANLESARAYSKKSDAAYSSIAEFPKPTIAMIRGYCIGGGLGLATCCDLRICSDNSRFAVPAAKLGIGYGYVGLKRLVDIVGPSFAKEIFYTARQFDAQEAAAMGLVNRVVPSAKLENAVKTITDMICVNAPLTIKAVKFTVGEILKDEFEAQRRAYRRDGGAVLHQPRLQRRPRRVHGKAQAGLHRHLSATTLSIRQKETAAGVEKQAEDIKARHVKLFHVWARRAAHFCPSQIRQAWAARRTLRHPLIIIHRGLLSSTAKLRDARRLNNRSGRRETCTGAPKTSNCRRRSPARCRGRAGTRKISAHGIFSKRW